jgi:4-amino-4-deoxy-L-arabinose transferase-like glycosyltransferase
LQAASPPRSAGGGLVPAEPTRVPLAPRDGVLAGVWADALILGIALAVAAAVRWPNLWLIPAFSDETREAGLAMAIYRGQAAPLTNVNPYIGSFWNYLLAAGFWIFGLSPWLPRLVAFLGGVATVGATWWLGRELGGRLGGAVAAGFMAANSTHILVNSHVGWSHAITPLFTTLGLACLARVLSDTRHPVWLVAAGALLGIGVQTHVTAALLLPGAALAVLARRPALLRTRWAIFAVAAFLAVNANLIAYNVLSGGHSFTGGLEHITDYTGEETGYDTDAYLENLGRLTLAGSWILSGAIEKRRFIGESLADPILLLYLIPAVGAVLWAARRGRRLPLLAMAPYVLILPLLNPKYEPLLNGRYLAPLLPLVFGSVGLAASDAWRALRTRAPRRWPAPSALLAVGLTALAAYPLVPLARYERSTDRTNEAALAAHRAVLAHREPGETVLLDRGLDGIFSMAAGSAYKSMALLLSGHDVPYAEVDGRANSVGEALAERSPRLVVLHGDKVAPLRRAFAVTPVAPPPRGAGFGVYRVAPRQ